MIQIAAIAIHQPRQHGGGRGPGFGHGATQSASAVVKVDRLIAILVTDAFEVCGNSIKSFIPANSLKATFAALAHTLHGIFDPVGIVNSAPDRASPQASANLVLAPFRVSTGIVGTHPLDDTITHMKFYWAAAAAVDGTGRPNHFFITALGGQLWVSSFVVVSRCRLEWKRCSQKCQSSRRYRTQLYKSATTEAGRLLNRVRHNRVVHNKKLKAFIEKTKDTRIIRGQEVTATTSHAFTIGFNNADKNPR